MKARFLAALSLITLALMGSWLLLSIAENLNAGLMEYPDEDVWYVAHPPFLYFATLFNGVLVTIATTVLFASLYSYLRHTAPDWALIGLIFLPVYCALYLFFGLSQIAVMPELASASLGEPTTTALYTGAVSLSSLLVCLADALLGVSCLIFGVLLTREPHMLRVAGTLLAVSGVAYILGIAGAVQQTQVFVLSTLVGVVIQFPALILLARAWLRGSGGIPK